MNSSFPNRWSFSYLKFTKYVTNIIAEPKYKYGQQEQATVRNHNRSTALERSVLKYWGGLKSVLRVPNLALGFSHGSKHSVVRSAWRFSTSSMDHHEKKKSQINTVMKQRWGLDRNVMRQIPGDPRGVEQPTETLEKKKTNNWTPVGQATDKKCSGPNQLKSIALCRGHHWVWPPTHRRAIKEESKVINRDWVKH